MRTRKVFRKIYLSLCVFIFLVPLNTCSSFASTDTVTSTGKTILKLHTFEAISIDIGVTIRWISNSENNISHYIVERSSNGNDFIEIARVDAAGNSNMLVEYLLVDNDPLPGSSYYRIRRTDKEGEYFRTEPFIIIRDEEDTASNALKDSIGGNAMEDIILVRDNSGDEYFSKVILIHRENEIIAIDPEKNIPPGTYVVVATSRNQIRSSRIKVE